MSWSEFGGTTSTLVDSPRESARFGVRVARLVVADEAAPDDVHAAIDAVDPAVDVLVVRHLAGHRSAGAVMAGGDRLVLPAGTLTYWETAAEPRAHDPAGPSVTRADDTSAEAAQHVVVDVVTDSFASYGNHYSVDPLLDDGRALAGYVEWAASTLTRDPGDVLTLSEDGRPIGVATLAEQREDGDLEVLLAGVVQAAQGRGRYRVLLDAAVSEAARRDLRRLIISTQSHNVRVQRAWARAGLRPFAAVETVHLVHRRHQALLSRA